MSGITAGSIALAAATTLGGALISKMMAPSPEKPGTPQAAGTIGDTEADKAARAAQKRQREAAAAAVGRQDTILTGGGLGSAGSTGNAATKTLLGL